MQLLEFLLANGATLGLGISLVLATGCLAVWWARSPAERRRLGALSALALLLYAAAAVVPMPRLALPRWQDSRPASTSGLVVAAQELVREPALPATPPPIAAVGRTLAPTASPPRTARSAPEPALAPESRPAAQAPPPRYGVWLAVVFLAGSLAAALWLLLGYLRLWGLLRECRRAPAWLGADSPVPVFVTAGRTRAFCTGFFRPVVVLPADLAVPARAAAARAVLAHELAHVRGGDCRVQLLFALLLPLCWWQPLFWWLRERVRFSSEVLADDEAAHQSSVRAYVRELLELAEAGHARVAHAGALSVFHRPSEFYRRIQMLLGREVPLSRSVPLRRRVAGAVGALTMVAVAASFCGVGRAQEPPPGEGQQAAQLQQMVRDLRAEVEALRKQLAAAEPVGASGLERYVAQVQALTGAVRTVDGLELMKYASRLDPQPRQATYTVRKGDSLATIARQECGDAGAVERILECNPGLDLQPLRVGQQIVLPPRPDAVPDTQDPLRAPPAAPHPLPAHAPVANRSLTDLLNVVTRCVELRGEVEIAESELEHLAELSRQAATDRHSVRIAEIKVRTSRRQLDLAERLLKAELENAKGELQRLEKLRAAGMITDDDARLRSAGTFLEVLTGFF